MEKLQYGTTHSADLHENTITFEMQESITICAGEFAIIKIDTLYEKIKLEEFIELFKKQRYEINQYDNVCFRGI